MRGRPPDADEHVPPVAGGRGAQAQRTGERVLEARQRWRVGAGGAESQGSRPRKRRARLLDAPQQPAELLVAQQRRGPGAGERLDGVRRHHRAEVREPSDRPPVPEVERALPGPRDGSRAGQLGVRLPQGELLQARQHLQLVPPRRLRTAGHALPQRAG